MAHFFEKSNYNERMETVISNIPPVGGLKLVKNNKNNEYRDANGFLWRKRGFFNSLLHILRL